MWLDDPLAIFQRALRQLLKRFACGGHRLVRIVENPVTAGETRTAHRRRSTDFR